MLFFDNLGANFGTDPRGVACNGSGSIVYVVDAASDTLFKSINSGVDFVDMISSVGGAVNDVTCSDDGNIVYVLDGALDELYRSDDAGVNFTSLGSPFDNDAFSVACDSSGSIVYVVDRTSDKLYYSTDSGVSFSESLANIGGVPQGVSCTNDGVIVYVSDGQTRDIFKSIDSGATFTNIGTPANTSPISTDCSGDGEIVYCVDNAESSLYQSLTAGTNFSNTGNSFGGGARCVACSNDGEVVYVIDNDSNSLYRSGIPIAGYKPENIEHIETGDLLGAKAVKDIVTGDLLTGEAVNEVVTGDLLTAIPLPAESDFPLNHARIGYDNMLTDTSAVNDPTGALNLLSPATYDRWRPGSNSLVLLTGDAQECNYIGIAAHNLFSDGASLAIRVSNGGASFIYVYQQAPTSDGAIFIRFDTAVYDRVEINITGSTNPEIGVVFMGLELEMMRPIFSGHRPSILSATDKTTPQMSDGGQFLGKQIVRQGYATSADFQHLTDEWYRDKFQPFVEHAKTRPYFWAWNLLESPDDVVYGWTNDNISPSYMGIRNWLEVSFSIEAHA